MVVAVEVQLQSLPGLSTRAYTTVLDQVTYALEDIDYVAHPARATRPTWTVTSTQWTAGQGPLVMLSPMVDLSRRSAADLNVPGRALVEGVRALGEVPEIPALFDEGIVQRVTEVRQLVEKPSRGLTGVTLASVNGQRSTGAPVSEQVARNALAAVTPASYAYGSLTGVLDVISSRKKKRRIGLLTDHGSAVTCNTDQIPQDQLFKAFESRVTVSGLLRRNGRGQPVRLDAERLDPAPRIAEAVSALDLVGSWPDVTGDRTTAEFLEWQRGR